MATYDSPMLRMRFSDQQAPVEFPARAEATGYTTRDLRDPEYVSPDPEGVPLIAPEVPVLWKGAL